MSGKNKVTGYAGLVPATDMVTRAWQHHAGIGAFNVNNLEWAHAIINGALAPYREHLDGEHTVRNDADNDANGDNDASEPAPHDVILQVTMGAAKYMGGYQLAADMVEDILLDLRDRGELPSTGFETVLHADHADYGSCLAAIDAGFTSVMFDGSALPIDDNLAKSREIIRIAHDRGVSVEVEVGTIGGSEDGVYGSGEISPITDVLKMAALRPDMMAVGIGNIHGPYPAGWLGLDFEYLAKVQKALTDNALGLPLVLHGGSGIPDDQIARAISMGVVKINVNTELQLVFAHEIIRKAAALAEDGEDKMIAGKTYDPRALLKEPTIAMSRKVDAMARFFNNDSLTSEVAGE